MKTNATLIIHWTTHRKNKCKVNILVPKLLVSYQRHRIIHYSKVTLHFPLQNMLRRGLMTKSTVITECNILIQSVVQNIKFLDLKIFLSKPKMTCATAFGWWAYLCWVHKRVMQMMKLAVYKYSFLIRK
jgi:hypothetical protein